MNTTSEEVAKATNGVEAELEAPTEHKFKMKKAKETDAFVLLVQEISTLSAEEAVAEVPKLLNAADQNYFRLGGFLSTIQLNKYYTAKGYETFHQFVEGEYGMKRRKAQYWMQIYDDLIESSVPWAKVKDIGWTKLRDLAPILTVENADEWVQRALSSTVPQLREAVAKAKAGSLPNSGITPTDDEKSNVTAFTVKMHDDQKMTIKEAIQKARTEAKTEYDGVALEAIALNYLSGGNVNQPKSLVSVLEKYTPEVVLEALEKVFPDFIITAKLKAHVCG